jgi:asparagine synthetase B (glutamine-hydrolysing)
MPMLGGVSALASHTPGALRRAGARALARAGGWLHRSSEVDRLASICREPAALPHPFFFARTIHGPSDVARLAPSPSARAAIDGRAAWRKRIEESAGAAAQLEPFTAVSYLELRSYMVNTLLRDADAMSMAHALELRVPLLDHPVVEFVAAQADAVKQRPGVYKALLADAVGDLVPREVWEQPKSGFTFPWARWLRNGLAPRVASGLRDLAPPLAARLDRAAVSAEWQAFQAGRADWLRPWSLYVLNAWVQRHL